MSADPRAELRAQLVTVREHMGSDGVREVVRLLDLMREVYRDDLERVEPGNLQMKQGASRQVRLLREALTAASSQDTPIV